jgi:peptidoglycan hydrolase-like protein with peptidoglycan-binding domain
MNVWLRQRGERAVSYSEWFRRLASGRGANRPWARKSVLITAGSAALVVIAGVAILLAGPGKTTLWATSVAASHQQAAARKPAVALQVTSVTPGPNSRSVNGTAPIQVGFSAPLAQNSPLPRLSPSVPGSWQVDGASATFTPATGFPEDTAVTLTLPGGSSGIRSAAGAKAGAGGLLASGFTRSFTTGSYSTLRLEQLLAQLGYLPLTWTPSGTAIQASDAAGQLAAAYSAPSGSFSWQGGYPSVLQSLWSEGSNNLIVTGAVRAFQSEQGLTMDGVAGPQMWSDLLEAVAAGHGNGNGYTYALASKAIPETLTIWHDGREVMQTPANTGIPVAPTVDGTFPVYEKLTFQIMQGTNPGGSTYADPVSWVSYFNGGDAVHYFDRGSYGWPQSLGCVELPESAAETAYGYLSYGSLVTVAG